MPARSLAALVSLRVIDDKAGRRSGQSTDDRYQVLATWPISAAVVN
jgi:hypothetical protein